MNNDVTKQFDPKEVEAIIGPLLDRQTRVSAEMFAKFVPEELITHYVFEAAQWVQSPPLILNLPKGVPIGGIYCENKTGDGQAGSIVKIFLGAEAMGEPFFDVGPGNFKSYPANPYDGYSIVTVTLDAATPGRVRIILSSKKLGPAQGAVI